MTENDMQDYLELFADDGIESYWDERTEDKQLLFASHDGEMVLGFIVDCPLSTEAERKMAELLLASLTAEKKRTRAMKTLGNWYQEKGQA
jgi:hypothetical protein